MMIHETHDNNRALAAIILAAGRGRRMGGQEPKVIEQVAGRPMVQWVIDAAVDAGADRIILVVGHDASKVRASLAAYSQRIEYAIQDEQRGTGHATRCAGPVLDGFGGDVIVLAGDGPLVRASTLRALHLIRTETSCQGVLATARIDDPTGYGRILRNEDGGFEKIVEHRNATEEQQLVQEIYPSYACYDAQSLFTALEEMEPDAESGEYFVTDVPSLIQAGGGSIVLLDACPQDEVLSVNTAAQRDEVETILQARLEKQTT